MESAKIRLSEEEHALIKNSNWILTKNSALLRVNELLASLQDGLKSVLLETRAELPADAKLISPKISRGENYHGLPWLMLDYPRIFEKENIFALRTMFLWGHYFSCTLHLSGKFKERYQYQVLDHLEKHDGLYLSVYNEWNHLIAPPAYNGVADAPGRDNIIASPFMKIAGKIGLDDWENAGAAITRLWTQLIQLLED